MTVGYALATGFDRAAARRPARRDRALRRREPRARVDARVSCAAEPAAPLVPLEIATTSTCAARGHDDPTRRVETSCSAAGAATRSSRGATCARAGEAVVERGLAATWDLRPGRPARRRRLRRCASSASRSRPTTSRSRSSAGRASTCSHRGRASARSARRRHVNVALLWLARPGDGRRHARAGARGSLRDRAARSSSRARASGSLLGQAAGIVISLLVAFSLVALAAAGDDARRGAHAEVQRRLHALGVSARSASRRRADRGAAGRSRPRSSRCRRRVLGVAVGLARSSRARRTTCSRAERARPRRGCSRLLARRGRCARRAPVVAVAAAVAGLARRAAAAGRALRGGDVSGVRAAAPLGAGPVGLGVAARARAPAAAARTAVAVLAVCAGVRRCSMLALASLLERLAERPGARRPALPDHRRRAGLMRSRGRAGSRASPAPRRATTPYAADSFDLGESLELVAFRGDHTRFEAPPLAEGRRLRGPARGRGRASGSRDALGLQPGSMLAAQLQAGARCASASSASCERSQQQGRVAYVARRGCSRPSRRSSRRSRSRRPSGSGGAVRDELARSGLFAASSGGVAGGAVQAGRRGTAASLRRSWRCCAPSPCSTALVCVYALVQVLALTASERRQGVAVLRALGAGRAQITMPVRGFGSPARGDLAARRPSSPRGCCSGRRRPVSPLRTCRSRSASEPQPIAVVGRSDWPSLLSWLPPSWAGRHSAAP